MKTTTFNIDIFEKTEGVFPYSTMSYEHIDPDFITALNPCRRTASAFDIHLVFHPQPINRNITHTPFHGCDAHPHRDFAMCLYPSLNDVGTEVGNLILGMANQYFHVFIITKRRIPDMDDEIKRGLNCISKTYVQRGTIIEPIGLCTTNGDNEVFDAEEEKLLSYWTVNDLKKNPEIRKQMLSIMLAT